MAYMNKTTTIDFMCASKVLGWTELFRWKISSSERVSTSLQFAGNQDSHRISPGSGSHFRVGRRQVNASLLKIEAGSRAASFFATSKLVGSGLAFVLRLMRTPVALS
jgi:hypothetical protein